MKMYKVLDNKENRDFCGDNNLIGYAFEGIESGEYVILTINKNTTITILLNNVEVLEGDNLMNRNKLDDGIKWHEVIGESVKGYRVIYSTENIKNIFGEYTKRVMRVIVYNFNTKEVVYSTGNNLRLDYHNLFDYTNEILYLIDKYVDDNYNLKSVLDNLYYNCSINLEMLRKEYDEYLITNYYQKIEDNCNIENIELQNKLNKVVEEKDITIIGLGKPFMAVIKVLDDRLKNKFYNLKIDDYFYKLLFDDNFKDHLSRYINEGLLYVYHIDKSAPFKGLYDTNKRVYIYDSAMNNMLKWLINYIENNIIR